MLVAGSSASALASALLKSGVYLQHQRRVSIYSRSVEGEGAIL